MNKIKSLVIAAAFLAVGSLAFVGCKSACCSGGDHAAKSSATQYTCAMHTEIMQANPGKCPKCSMALTEKP